MRVENRDTDFQHLDDNELVLLVQDGDTQALEFLIQRYKSFVRAKAKTYFLVGADHEDIAQEGMIGLYKAIRDFQEPLKLLQNYVLPDKLLPLLKQLQGKNICR